MTQEPTTTTAPQTNQVPDGKIPDKNNKSTSKQKFTQLSIEEYRALQNKESKKFKGFTVPKPVKILLSIPVLLLFAAAVIYIPFQASFSFTPESSQEKQEAKK